MHDPQSLLGDLIAEARKAGADAADAVLISGTSLSVSRRLGKTEHVEQSEGQDLGLRVFLGQRAAIVSSTTIDPTAFATLAERAVAMAKVVPEDPYAGLADTAAPPEAIELDMLDSAAPSAAELVERAAAAEDSAMAVAGITNSEGADAGYSRSELTLATSAGFAGRRVGTSYSISATAIAGSGTGMQRDYDYHSTVHMADLDDPASIGHRAAERAVARLNPARPKTAKVPVVFDPRIAGGLLGHLSGAINGSAVARGTSFLKDKMGERIFAAGINIHDDPRRVRGLRSRAFDAEGTPTRARALIEDGVLTTWLLDSRAARQLGLQSTGHAARGIGGPPSPSATNLYLAAGSVTP
ncbi:MAG: TldD/PmbA family protein, partial [Rhodopila sp.]